MTLIYIILAPSLAHAGAWTQKKGDLFLAENAYIYRTDDYFDDDGHRRSQPEFRKNELNTYVEYGWRDGLTVGTNLFLHEVEQDNGSGSDQTIRNMGLADSEFFSRYQLKRTDDYSLSLQPLLKLPSLYQRGHLPKAGSDNFDAELSLMGGYNFTAFNRAHYIDSRIGYRHRIGTDQSDQLRADIQVGLTLAPSWRLVPAVYTTWSTDLSTHRAFAESGENDYDLVKLETALQYQLSPDMTIQAGAFSHAYGRNTGNGHGLFFGTAFLL